jgi:hypothetical protein
MLLKRMALIAVLMQASLAASTYSFTLVPTDGVIVGGPDQTVGWGYTLSNQSSTDWLLTTAVNSSTSFLYATGAQLFDFPILNPGASVTVSFDATLSAGLFKLTWDANVPIGTENTGLFLLSAEWWDGDPLMGGAFLGLAEDSSQPYVAIASNASSTVPEPASGALFALGLSSAVALFIVRRPR